jgi:hypothetical protein
MAAREYDPKIGRFLSADTIVPGAGNPQSFNRFSYVNNRPMSFIDPSGHDPLNSTWRADFLMRMGRDATAEDESVYLFSIAYPSEYQFDQLYELDNSDQRYYVRANALNQYGPNTGFGRSWSAFPDALDRLASHYTDSEKDEFVRDVGMLWGGLPSRSQTSSTWAASASAAGGQLTNRNVFLNGTGLPARFNDGDRDGNVHHWGAFLVFGYATPAAALVNTAREQLPGAGSSQQDVAIGNIAVGIAGQFRDGDLAPIMIDRTQHTPRTFSALVVQSMGIAR